MRIRPRVVVVFALNVGWMGSLAGLAACSSDSSNTAVPLDATTTETASASIGASGGTVKTSDGTGVSLPAGALASNTTITVTETPSAALPPSATTVSTPYTFGPEGTHFAVPVTVTLDFDPTRLPAGATASNIVVYTAPAGTTSFTALPTQLADATHVTAQTTHFSVFVAAVGSGAADAGASPDATLDATVPTGDEDAAPASDGGDGGDAAACDPNVTWPAMIAAPVAPPSYASVNWAAASNAVTIEEVNAQLCDGTPIAADAGENGNPAMSWGAHGEVYAEYDPTSHVVNFLQLNPGVTGSLTMHSRTGGAYGNGHTYVVSAGHTITRDGAPFDVITGGAGDAGDSDAEVTELFDAYLATFLPDRSPAPSDCTSAGSCVVYPTDGDGHSIIGFRLPTPYRFYIYTNEGTSVGAGFYSYPSEEVACDTSVRWPVMLADPIAPPTYAGINFASPVEIQQAVEVNCSYEALYGTNDPNDKALTWGNHGEVYAETTTLRGGAQPTAVIGYISLNAGYTGTMTMHSRTGGAYGTHTYVVGIGTMTKDSGTFSINWTSPDAAITELYDAYLATFEPAHAAAPTDCVTSGACSATASDGAGNSRIEFNEAPPYKVTIVSNANASVPTSFEAYTVTTDADAGDGR